MAKKRSAAPELAFRAVFEKRGRWVIGSSPDVPGANSQERTLPAARRAFVEAVRDLVELDRELARKLRPARAGVLADETPRVRTG